MAAIIIAFLVSFVYLMFEHDKFIKARLYSSIFVKINENSLSRLNGEWENFSDNGKDFLDENHQYAYDLDIFGDRSLFQWINVANTYLGRKALCKLLLGYSKEPELIKKRQDAVNELAEKLAWRQKFLAEGLIVSENIKDPQKLISWAKEQHEFYKKPWLAIVIKVLPVITVLSLILAFSAEIVPYYIPGFLVLIQYFMLKYKKWERLEIFEISDRFSKDIGVYNKMIELFEKNNFQSDLLKEIQSKMAGEAGKPAYDQINSLAKIIDSISARHAPLYLI